MQWHKSLLALAVAGALAACGGGGGDNGGGDGGGDPTPEPVSLSVLSSQTATPDKRLACYQGNGEAACNLRMYQIMVEAFIDGDSSANYNTAYGPSHHKGDLQGIINSLPYIKSLGVNTIWMTPVFASTPLNGQDPSIDRLDGTGYFASDYFNVDPKFGTNEQLRELIDTAHEMGMYVILDGVFGHYKSNIAESPTGKLPVNGQCTNSSGGTYGPGATDRCADFSQPATLAFFKEVAEYWITEYNIDGWRLDQAYQVPVGLWDDIRETVETASANTTYVVDGQEVNPLGYMVAELWQGEAQIKANGYGNEGSPALLSSFDFPVRYRVVQTFAVEESGAGGFDATNLKGGFLNQALYPTHAMPNLMLGNHDLVRFGDLVQRGGFANPADAEYWARHKAALSFMAAYSGPITLYYGDEIGQEQPGFAARNANCVGEGTGGKWCDDNVSRTTAVIEGQPTTVGGDAAVLSEQQSDLKEYVSGLMAMRDAHPALFNGSRTHIYSDARIFMDRKDNGNDNVLYVVNTKDAPVTLTVAATAIGSDGALDGLNGAADVALAGGNYVIELEAFEAKFFDIVSPTAEGPQTGGNTGGGGDYTGEGELADCTNLVTNNSDLGVLASDEIFIRGSFADSGWDKSGTRQVFHQGNNLYKAVINEIEGGPYQFKLAYGGTDGWQNAFGASDRAIPAEEMGVEQAFAVASGEDSNTVITIPASGDYVYSFQFDSTGKAGTMMVSKCE